MASVEAPERVRMVKAIEARGALDIAKRCLQMCSQVFRYVIAHGIGGKSQPGVRQAWLENYDTCRATQVARGNLTPSEFVKMRSVQRPIAARL